MNWSHFADRSRRLWRIEEAEMDEDDSSRVGWVQVGLEHDVELAAALIPLLRCLEDSVRRLSASELTGFRVAVGGAKMTHSGVDLVSGLNWFRAHQGESVVAEVVLDDDAVDITPTLLSDRLMNRNTRPFTFGLPRPSDLRRALRPGEIPLLTSLPEWSSDAAALALAAVVDATRCEGDERSFVAWISRRPDLSHWSRRPLGGSSPSSA